MSKEETYSLTLKGLLSTTIQDPEVLKNTMDLLELYLRRHYSKDGHPGIIFNLDSGEFEFVTLGKKD